ncbi:PLAT/LH2 domain-containing protein [Lentzea sp. NPDC034063]|uniref:PLAT/LH2 domain-containing protein n=1 Tax=unclassified Lentzea TaxID=2643253 RepID=UPI003408849E
MKKVATTAAVGVLAAAFAGTLAMGTAQAAPGQYRIEVQTCDVPDAGTDSRVEARINGSTSSSGWINLDNPGDDRERGDRDVYDRTLSEVGAISSIDIAFDNKGDSSHWCLVEVVIRGPQGVTVHPYGNWLRSATTKNNPLRLPAA